jgi:hypothetical protein
VTGRDRFARGWVERAAAAERERLIRRQRRYLLVSALLGAVCLGLWTAAALGWWTP